MKRNDDISSINDRLDSIENILRLLVVIVNAKMDTDMLKAKIAEANRNKADIDKQTDALKQEAERIINSIRNKIKASEIKEW